MLDIFRTDAFGVVPLSLAINKLIFIPGYISSQGIYSEKSVSTTAVAIEENNKVLRLIGPTPRGGPGWVLPKPRRALRMLAVPHFEINDSIMAEEVQGVRPFGEESGTEGVMTKVGERMQVAGQSLEYTQEYARVGGIKGIVQYADGSTLDLYREYDIAPPTPVDLPLESTANDGELRKAVAQIIRTMGTNLDGLPYTGIEAIVGDDFFDALIKNAEIRTTYLNYTAAAELRQPYVNYGGQIWGTFVFGGVRWTNYRGYIDGEPMVETDMAYLYPSGVPDLFVTFYAPADYIETVNTMGKPKYVKQYTMLNDKGVAIDTQTNALNICTRPAALMRAKL